MQFNDDVFTQFGDLGYTGTYNDRFFEFLGDQGYTGTLQDRMYKWFGDLGYTGGFADRWFQWAVGGFLVGEAPVISDLVVDEGAPSIDFTVTGADGTAYIVLSANAVETAEDIFAWSDPDTLFTFPVTLGGVSESLDFSAVPDGTYYIHVIVANGALLSNVLTDGPYVINAAPVRSKTYLGGLQADNSGSVLSGSIDIGTADAARYILVAIGTQGNSQAGTTVVVNGTSLTQLVAGSGLNYYTAFFGGLVTTGSGSVTVTVTFASASFQPRYAELWSLLNLGSTTLIASDVRNNNITSAAVTADDYLFVASYESGNGTETFATSPTQAADRFSGRTTGGGLAFVNVEWDITATSGSFNPGMDATTNTAAYVRFA